MTDCEKCNTEMVAINPSVPCPNAAFYCNTCKEWEDKDGRRHEEYRLLREYAGKLVSEYGLDSIGISCVPNYPIVHRNEPENPNEQMQQAFKTAEVILMGAVARGSELEGKFIHVDCADDDGQRMKKTFASGIEDETYFVELS